MENIRLAIQGIWDHKMRSFLTMLGIIIGIAAIITIVSTIKGTNEQIKQNLIGSGTNVVTVQLYQDNYPYDFGFNPPPAGVKVIDESCRAELEKLNSVQQVAFFNMRQFSDNISAGKINFNGNVLGIDRAYLDLTDYQITYGRNFSPKDFANARKVAIIDSKTASALFPGKFPIGQTIEIKKEPFVIIGIVEKANAFTPNINTLEDYFMYADTDGGNLFIPNSTWPIVYRFDEPQSVAIRVNSTDEMTTAGKNVADYLTASQISSSVAGSSDSMSETDNADTSDAMSHGGNMSAGSNFSYRSEDLLKQAQQLQEMSNATNQQLIWIASISLLVGGIGVMNIMLVSVTERTSEIGLKKALGAKRKLICFQFLTEAAVLTSLGGIIGIVFGIILAKLISTLNGIPVAISAPAIIISFVFSLVIGVVFGMLPAVKAAKLNPIDALRRD